MNIIIPYAMLTSTLMSIIIPWARCWLVCVAGWFALLVGLRCGLGCVAGWLALLVGWQPSVSKSGKKLTNDVQILRRGARMYQNGAKKLPGKHHLFDDFRSQNLPK